MNLAEARAQLARQPGTKAAIAVQILRRTMNQNARAVRAGFHIVGA